MGDRIDVKCGTARNVYDNETDGWIFKDSSLFENVEIEDINDDENDHCPFHTYFGANFPDEERHYFVKLPQVKKIYR